MDAPIAERTRLKLKRKAAEAKAIALKRARFYGSSRHQNFSLPDSIIYYITKNPSSPEIYEKLRNSCKYFFVKNSILILYDLFYDEYGWRTCNKRVWENVTLNNLLNKIWLTGTFHICPRKVSERTVASSCMQKIRYFNVDDLHLHHQNISFNELMLLSSNVKHLELYECNVMNQDGTAAALETIVGNFPKLKGIDIRSTPTVSGISSKTFAELLKIPQFLTLDFFKLCHIPEEFNLENFYTYMKKNKTTKIVLGFADTISDAYISRLESIVDEIIEAEEHDYRPPWIEFDGLDWEKLGKLRQIFRKHP